MSLVIEAKKSQGPVETTRIKRRMNPNGERMVRTLPGHRLTSAMIPEMSVE
jgi:hypothetical protein